MFFLHKVKIWTIFVIVISFLMSSCQKGDQIETRIDKYIMFMFSNKHVDEIEDYLPEMKVLYGDIDSESSRMYAFGVVGPMLLTQSIEQMQYFIEKGFDYAEKYQIPVYFQLDDVTNYTTYYGKDAEIKFYEHPEMCEWIKFPEKNEAWGGQNEYGKLPAFWFNWGIWLKSPAFPNLASEEFKNLISRNFEEGVLKPLNARYKKLINEGKSYLFAGMAIGWETHIPDYSASNSFLWINPDDPPKEGLEGEVMQEWELSQYGYAALHSLGYDQNRLESEAAAEGKNVESFTKGILFGVIHDFSEFMAKQAFDSGIPRTKIFTHMVSLSTARIIQSTFSPPTWCAVNPYSVPGFTMSPVTCPYDIDVLKTEIGEADPEMRYFGCTEGYAAGLHDEDDATRYLNEMFDNGALLVSVFSYADMGTRLFHFSRSPDFGFNKAVVEWLGN